jgi:bifunctional DNase/RNase
MGPRIAAVHRITPPAADAVPLGERWPAAPTGPPGRALATPSPRWLAVVLAFAALGAGSCGGGCASPARQAARGGAGEASAPAPPAAASPGEPDPSVAVDGDYLPAEIATIGWDGLAQSPIVLVRDLSSGRVVPIWVGLAEAQSIAAALHEVEFPRPMTHDLMANLLTRLDARMEELLIHALIDNTYFALIRLRVPGSEQPLLIDTRPSDGMALALRTGAAIRMSRRIVEQSPDFEFMAPEGEDQVVRALGLTLVAPSADLRDRFGLPERPGLVVTRAVGEAEEKGLRRGDLIVSVGGQVAAEPVEFLDVLRDAPVDRPLTIVYWRDGAEHTVELDPTADEAVPKPPPRMV